MDAFPLGIAITDGQGRLLQTNSAACLLLGLPASGSRSILSREWSLFDAEGQPMAAEDFPGVRALRLQSRVEEPEMGVLRSDGEMAWLNITAVPMGPERVLITFADVTEVHRSKTILAARSRLAERAPGLVLGELLRAILDEAEVLTGSTLGFLHFVEEDQESLRLQAWSTRTEAGACRAEGAGMHYPISKAGVWADCVRERRPVIHNHFAGLPNRKGTPDGHVALVRELTVPILRSGKVVAVIGLGNKATDYRDTDVDSLQRLADLAWDLAESKRTQESLQEQNLSFREVIQNSPLAMLVAAGSDEKVLFLNHKFEEMFGYSQEEIHSIADWWPRAYPDEAYRQQVQGEWAELERKASEEKRAIAPHNVTVTCKDGSTRFIRIEIGSLGDTHTVTFTDLTGHRKMEEILSFLATCGASPGMDFFQSLARFLAEKLDMDYVCIDRLEGEGMLARTVAVWSDGRFDDNVVYALRDTPCGEVVGRKVCCYPNGVAGLFPQDQALQNLRAESYVGVTLWDHSGKPIGLIAVIGRRPLADPALIETVMQLVAVRAAGELERNQAEDALREANQFNEQIIRSAHEGIIVYSPDLRCQVWNPFMEHMTGLPASEVLGRHPLEVYPYLKEAGIIDRLEKALAGEAPQSFDFPYTITTTGRSGWTTDTSAPLRNSKGEIIGVIGTISDISERKQAEAALRESTELLSLFIHNSPIFAYIKQVTPTESRVVQASENFREMIGIPGSAMVGKAMPELFPAEMAERMTADDWAVVSSGKVLELDEELNGRSYTTLKFPIVQANRTLLAGFTIDITERKEAEVRLIKLSNQVPGVVYQYRLYPDGRSCFPYSSSGMLEIYEVTPEEVREDATPVFGRLHPDDREGTAAAIQESARTQENFHWEFRVVLPRQGLRWRLCDAKPERLPDGSTLWYGIITDITERKEAERQLRDSEARFRALVENAPEAIVVLDMGLGRFINVNEKACRLYQTSREELLAKGPVDFSPPFQPNGRSSAELALEYMQQAVDGGTPHFEWVHRNTQGVDIPCEINLTRLPSSKGVLVRGSVVDITERRRMEAEKARLQLHLQQVQKMESLGSLAGGVAHDMNNVLGAILGLASANVESQPAGSPAHRAFETIITAAVRGGKMVKSLLSFSRQSPAEERELDVNAILQEEVRLLERTTLSKVRLELDLASDLRPIRGDASALTHCFMNLCVNAVDAMREGGALRLVSRNVDDNSIEIQVKDTGTGMSREVLEKALDPFFTTKEIGKGTGLGLSIAYSTVKAHQGQMEIQSEPGRGTLVKLRFPACEQVPQAVPSSPEPASGTQGARLKVLLVDDDELIQSSIRMILEVLGHDATVAGCGEEALEQLAAGLAPDLVILDMNMPGLGGAGTLPRLRALRPDTPVLLATGRADQAALDLLEAHPCVSLLSKPFSMRDLVVHLEPLRGK